MFAKKSKSQESEGLALSKARYEPWTYLHYQELPDGLFVHKVRFTNVQGEDGTSTVRFSYVIVRKNSLSGKLNGQSARHAVIAETRGDEQGRGLPMGTSSVATLANMLWVRKPDQVLGEKISMTVFDFLELAKSALHGDVEDSLQEQ